MCSNDVNKDNKFTGVALTENPSDEKASASFESGAFKTIAAISTPLAAGGLGVIRISGNGALDIGGKVFKAKDDKKNLSKMKGYTAAFGYVLDGDEIIDECVATVFKAPNSYTGEDTVELSCHGGTYILKRILRLVIKNGAKQADRGEFTRRAFMNGKLDLTRAEAVMDLISASGKSAARAALTVKEGATHNKINDIKSKLLEVAANFAAFVDYPDDDIPDLSKEALSDTVAVAEKELEKLLSTFDSGKLLREGVDTVIIGKPNVGKSTLMNLLVGSERSIVTAVAGTTRDIVEEKVNLGDLTLVLSDTAGVRQTEDLVESIGVERALKRAESASLVLVVFDSSSALDNDDFVLIDQLEKTGLLESSVAVINKSDLSQLIDLEYISSKFKHNVYISALSGDGKEALEQAVFEITEINNLDLSLPILANERQYGSAAQALSFIREAKEALAFGMTLDAVNVTIDSAISALLELTGEKASEAIIDEVFSRFCVGK